MFRRFSRGAKPKRPGRGRSSGFSLMQKFICRTETMINLKAAPKKSEQYLVPLTRLWNPEVGGTDKDTRVVGYKMTITVPSGDSLATVSLGLGHSGPWVRRGEPDAFNQITPMVRMKGKSLTFKIKMPPSEKQYLNPFSSTDPNVVNNIVVTVNDIAGVIPGASLVFNTDLLVVRDKPPVMLQGADQLAVDNYADQHVRVAGSPAPTASVVLPADVYSQNATRCVRRGDVSPVVYHSIDNDYTVTFTGTPLFAGNYVDSSISSINLQKDYTTQGYAGTIVRT